jgi:hypothetical protein
LLQLFVYQVLALGRALAKESRKLLGQPLHVRDAHFRLCKAGQHGDRLVAAGGIAARGVAEHAGTPGKKHLAFCGHSRTQVPQPTHRSATTAAWPSCMRIAFTGQTRTQR